MSVHTVDIVVLAAVEAERDALRARLEAALRREATLRQTAQAVTSATCPCVVCAALRDTLDATATDREEGE